MVRSSPESTAPLKVMVLIRPLGNAVVSRLFLKSQESTLDGPLVFCKHQRIDIPDHERESTMTAMFVNLPVTDLERAKTFYTAVGFTINPLFTDHNAACVVVEEDHSYFMILVREFFQTMTELPIGDPAVSPSSATAIFLDSREAVDEAVAKGLAAGGSQVGPPTDFGFMYQRGLTDPDGNVIDFGWMDPVAAAQGPAAFANQQA
jgi:predicted lactoylglutathione lyase